MKVTSAAMCVEKRNINRIENIMRDQYGGLILDFDESTVDDRLIDLSIKFSPDAKEYDIIRAKYFFYGLCAGESFFS